jgi:hypothetical protein
MGVASVGIDVPAGGIPGGDAAGLEVRLHAGSRITASTARKTARAPPFDS